MVQIVDGRDPLFFRSEDLVQYVHELNPNKKSLLLINKSDLVPQETRKRWNKYFNLHGVHHLFFSVKIA
jgi:large subunit GTPase 1